MQNLQLRQSFNQPTLADITPTLAMFQPEAERQGSGPSPSVPSPVRLRTLGSLDEAWHAEHARLRGILQPSTQPEPLSTIQFTAIGFSWLSSDV
jgi:hypothetical protein